MAVRERNGSWQADLTVNGVRHRNTFKTQLEAQTWHDDAKHEAKMGRTISQGHTKSPSKVGGAVTMLEVFDLTVRDTWSEAKSADKLILNAQAFLRWYGDTKSPTLITKSVISDYTNYLRTVRHNSSATVNRKLSAMRVMLATAEDHGFITSIPRVKRMKEPRGVINYLDFKEEDPILTHLKHRGYDALADLVVVLLDTGVRINEALRMEFSHIQPNGRILFPNRKSGNVTALPMTKRVRIALENRRLKGKDEALPFGDINARWARDNLKALYQDLGGRYATIEQPFHVFRHSCASRLALKGVHAARIMEYMDHSSLLVTQRYLHLSPEHLDDACSALEDDDGPNLSVVSSTD